MGLPRKFYVYFLASLFLFVRGRLIMVKREKSCFSVFGVKIRKIYYLGVFWQKQGGACFVGLSFAQPSVKA